MSTCQKISLITGTIGVSLVTAWVASWGIFNSIIFWLNVFIITILMPTAAIIWSFTSSER